MSVIEKTIQSIQDGMKIISEGINQLKQKSFIDIVREEQLEKFKLNDAQADEMHRKDIRAYYDGKYDMYDEKMHSLENDKKQIETFFQSVENIHNQLEEILKSKESFTRAYDVNLNNIKIVLNDVIGYLNRYSSDDEQKDSIPVKSNIHIDPKPKNIVTEGNKLQPTCKYVTENICKLEEWSGKKFSSIIYDSERDGTDCSIFREKIMNQSKLYFIVIDSNDNVFGHYHPGVIDKIGNCSDNDIFLFTLNSNGRSGVQKFNNKGKKTSTYIWNDDKYYSCGSSYDSNSYYCIDQTDTDCSFIIGEYIVNSFEGIKTNTLTGNCYPDGFETVRIIVIQMN